MGYGKFKFVIQQDVTGRDLKSRVEVFQTLTKMYYKYDWTYLVCGQEYCPTNGRPHIDGYYEMSTARKIKTELKKFNKMFHHGFGDLQTAEGSAGENYDYSTKDENEILIIGEPVKHGQRSDLWELKDQLLSGEITSEGILCNNPEKFHQYGRTFEKLEDIRLRQQFRTEMPDALWVCGPTGVGKSHLALKDYTPQTHYIWRNDNGWQDGYRQQETVVINDFRGEIPYNELLQIIDKWPYFLRRRNREPMPFTSPIIIITSSMEPAQVYCRQLEKADSIDQLKRRIRVMKIGGNGQGSSITPDHSVVE